MKRSKSPPPSEPTIEEIEDLAAAVDALDDLGADLDALDTRDLLDAAERGDASEVRAALALAANPNALRPDTGESALLLAIASDSADAVRALLEAGADPNLACDVARAGTSVAMRPLTLARFLDRPAIVELLTSGGAREAHPRGKRTGGVEAAVSPDAALALAIVFGDVARVRAALAAGASASGADPERGTPLLVLAVRAGRPEIVTALLDAGASANTEEAYGAGRRSALDVARQEERFELVWLLRARGGRPSRSPFRRTPPAGPPRPDAKLATAVAAGNRRGARARLEAGADANGVDGRGVPYLITAVRARDVALANLLLEYEAYPDAAHEGVSALHVAVEQGDLAMVEALLDEDADPRGTSVGDALIGLAPSPQAQILRRLLRDGLDPDLHVAGAPLLFHVVRERRLEALDLLLGHGADVGATDATGAHVHAIATDADVLARLRARVPT